MIKKWITVLVAVCAIALIMSCSNELNETEPIAVENVTLDKNAIILTPKAMDKLKATITPRNADDKTVAWSSSNDEVVMVSDDGRVTAVKEGTATITAQAGDKSATCTVTVCVHSYSEDRCTKCEFSIDGIIANDGVLIKYYGNEATVIIPDGVTGIGNEAFKDCNNIENVTIPDSVTEIGERAFAWCTSLKTITMPSSVTTIGEEAFLECMSLKDVTYDGTLAQWFAMDSDGRLMFYAKTLIMNDGTDFKGITEFVIPDDVKSIREHAFSGCKSLTSVTIPSSVTSIGDDAFYGCDSLTTVNYGGTLAQWFAMDNDGMLTFYAKALIMNDGTDFKSITGFVIPNGVNSIRKYAFYGCRSLTSVTIPDSVTSFGDSAFKGCSSLTNVNIPDGVTDIGQGAFYGCTNLSSITIPNGVRDIRLDTFIECTSLTSVTIPISIWGISIAFSGCTSLETVTFLGTKEEWETIYISEYSGLSGKTIHGKNDNGNDTTWTCK